MVADLYIVYCITKSNKVMVRLVLGTLAQKNDIHALQEMETDDILLCRLGPFVQAN